MIINESRTVSLGDGKSAYSYAGKYYIKSGDTKKEISKDQYDKLLQKQVEDETNEYATIVNNILDGKDTEHYATPEGWINTKK